jgi:hypothetical protein
MKRSQKNHKSSGQKQTILNFFSKVGETKKPQPTPQSKSVASLVKSTSTIDLTPKPTVSRTVSATSKLKSLTSRDSFVKTEKNAIDLTLDAVDLTFDSEQTSSQHSSQAEEIINTSKYSSRWWTPEIAKAGPLLSSQETVFNRSDDDDDDDDNTISVTMTQRRQKSAINTTWVGPNDVQPFSAGHVSRKYSYGPRRSIPIKMLQPSAAKRKPDQGDIRGWGDNEYKASQETFYVDPSTKLGQFAHMDKRPRYEHKFGSFGSSSSSPSSALFNNHGSKQYRPELSPQQERVLNMVMNDRKNLFFTGSAGTGKSVLLRGKLLKIECGSSLVKYLFI